MHTVEKYTDARQYKEFVKTNTRKNQHIEISHLSQDKLQTVIFLLAG